MASWATPTARKARARSELSVLDPQLAATPGDHHFKVLSRVTTRQPGRSAPTRLQTSSRSSGCTPTLPTSDLVFLWRLSFLLLSKPDEQHSIFEDYSCRRTDGNTNYGHRLGAFS